MLIIIIELSACGALVYFKLVPKFFPQQENLNSQLKPNKSTPSPKATTESASLSAQTDETANWKTFRSQKKDENFEFKYPSDWQIRKVIAHAQEIGDVETEVLTSPNKNLDISSSSGIELRFNEIDKKNKEESLLQYAKNNNACCSFQEVIMGQNITVAGEYQYEDSLNLNYYISNGERIIFVDVYMLVKEKADFINIIKQIISTFKFL